MEVKTNNFLYLNDVKNLITTFFSSIPSQEDVSRFREQHEIDYYFCDDVIQDHFRLLNNNNNFIKNSITFTKEVNEQVAYYFENPYLYGNNLHEKEEIIKT